MYHNILNDVGLKWNIHSLCRQNIQSYKCWFFSSINEWPTIKMTGLHWYLYLTQTTIVPSLAKLALIGNVDKILSVAQNITF